MPPNKFSGPDKRPYKPLRKFKVIMSGLRFAAINDFSVLYKIILSLIVLVPVLIFNTSLDVSILVLATGVMLTAELLNTAIESLCDYIQPEFDEKIGMIKDVAAAATGIAIFAWIVVIVIEILQILSHI